MSRLNDAWNLRISLQTNHTTPQLMTYSRMRPTSAGMGLPDDTGHNPERARRSMQVNGSSTCVDVSMHAERVSMHAQAHLSKRLSPHLSAATPGLRRLFTEPWLPPIARFWERDMGCDALRRGPASAVGFLGGPVLLRAVCFVRAMTGGPVAQEGGAPPARLTKQHEVRGKSHLRSHRKH